jgi:hypothetical protein
MTTAIKNGPNRMVLQAGAGSADVDVRALDPSGGVYKNGIATLVGQKTAHQNRPATGFIVWATGDILIEQSSGERCFLPSVTAGIYYAQEVSKIIHTGKMVSAETGTQTADLTTTASKVQLFWEP